MIKAIVANVNRERANKINPAKKQLEKIDKELEKLNKRKKKIFEAYEDEIITKDEFLARKEELNDRVREIEEKKASLIITLSDDVSEQIPYESIKNILDNFGKDLTRNISREQKKKLLHMIISEITMDELRNINSIKLKINDSLVEYLNKGEGVSVEGTPSSFVLRNIGLKALDLDVAIRKKAISSYELRPTTAEISISIVELK